MHLVRFLFLCISSASFDPHCDYLETANKITGKYEVIVDAQKSEISISADTDFDGMKKAETLSKRRRVGRYVTGMKNTMDVIDRHCQPVTDRQPS